eukprot:sb/3464639/
MGGPVRKFTRDPSIAPADKWDPNHVEHFRRIVTIDEAENLSMTVESVKSAKAHYGFKSRLNEYCQKNRIEQAVYDRPLNSCEGWKTSVSLKHPSKGKVTFQGFYQNKKNDAEASAAQHVIRDWDIQLLQSHEITDHWVEVLLRNDRTGECYNQSLVEVRAAHPKTSIYEMTIPKQPKDVPMPKSELEWYTPGTNGNGQSFEESDDEYDGFGGGDQNDVVEPEPLELPDIGDSVMMEVTLVSSLRNICCRMLTETRQLHAVEDTLTEFIKTQGRALVDPSVGALCAVRDEKRFLRGKVLRITKHNQAEVLMLDYGDTEFMKLDSLYILEQQFLTLPYQAISCILYGLDKVINEDMMIKKVIDEIDMRSFYCKVKDRVNERTLVVELYSNDDTETNMNERFLAIDVRNLRPNIKADSEAHSVKVTNVGHDGILSLQLKSGAGLDALNEVR